MPGITTSSKSIILIGSFLAQINSIGKSKVETAAERIKAINPAIQFTGFARQFKGLEDREFLVGTQVVIDALDNIPSRLDLARVCRELKIPLVHGAVSGWYGQLSTQFPGETTLEQIYGHNTGSQGPVVKPPVLSFAPATIASLQVAEAIKVITRQRRFVARKANAHQFARHGYRYSGNEP